MFYSYQSEQQKAGYKKMLSVIGSLAVLFSDSDKPYLPYRCHENIFCKYFEAENLARHDCSADAKKGNIGIGLKTWVGTDDQKVAEFGKLRPQYERLTGLELVKTISEYRNERIRITKNTYDIANMYYHIIKREPNLMRIFECSFDPIETENIKILEGKKSGANNIYFTDGKHTYHFSLAKNTLFMLFDDMNLLDSIKVDILEDPYEYLMRGLDIDNSANVVVKAPSNLDKENSICLRLYSTNSSGKKFVAEHSGLNQWNGMRTCNIQKPDGTIFHKETKRDPNELYIPYPAEDRRRRPDFFPPKDTSFNLRLPDGITIKAKVCQQDSKAIMSNPNSDLGRWLLRKVFELPEGRLVTYEMLEIFDIDSVIFTKIAPGEYSVDFAQLGTYEEYYGENEEQ